MTKSALLLSVAVLALPPTALSTPAFAASASNEENGTNSTNHNATTTIDPMMQDQGAMSTGASGTMNDSGTMNSMKGGAPAAGAAGGTSTIQ